MKIFSLLVGGALAHKHAKVAEWNDKNIVLDGEYGGPAQWYQVENAYANGKPPPPYDNSWQSKDSKIVVMVAALRETRLVDSLNTMLSTAKHPEVQCQRIALAPCALDVRRRSHHSIRVHRTTARAFRRDSTERAVRH